MRRQEKKERYFHIYPVDGSANESIIVKLIQKEEKLTSLTNHLGRDISIACLSKACGIKVEDDNVIVDSNYKIGEISGNRASRKYREFKTQGVPKWLPDQYLERCLGEVTM